MRSWLLRAWFALAMALAWSAAAAQYGGDRGSYQILQARYGTAAHNVDVTQRLQELARQDTRLRVSNGLFGVDPDVGAHKSLRIYARGPDGVTRMFETTEGGYVDGAQFTSWSVGGWNYGGYDGRWEGPSQAGDRGEYQILHARYGTPMHNIDVTGRLKELASRDRQFRVTNGLFGDDPDVGAHKTLRIFARDPAGVTRTFEYGENGLVDGAQFTGWSVGNWGYGGGNWGWEGSGHVDRGAFQILGARYGTSSRNVDVTERLRQLARADDRIVVTNSTFGDDPAVGVHKTLRIFARAPDGSTRIFDYPEGSSVDGAQFTAWRHGEWGRDARSLVWEGLAR